MILRIKGWGDIFENAASRKLTRMNWVAVPNKMEGEGYTALVDHPNGAAHLGAWLAIIEIASKQEPKENRGNLPGGPHHSVQMICKALSRISRLPVAVFEEVLPRLAAIEIGWLEEVGSNEILASASGLSPNAVADSPNAVADSGRLSVTQGITLQGIEEKNNTNAADAACAGDTVRSLLGKPPRPGKRTMEQIIKALGDRLPWWEKFWELYPCREGKLPGMDAFERVVINREIAQAVMNGANAYRNKFAADPTIRLKYAQGWLNDQRWTDEITEVVRRGPHTQSTEELAAAIEAFGRTR